MSAEDLQAIAAALTWDEAHVMAHASGNYIDRPCRKRWLNPFRNYYCTDGADHPTWEALVARNLAARAPNKQFYAVTALGLRALRLWHQTQKLLVTGRWRGCLEAHRPERA